MTSFNFLHAADLHLDSPLLGLSSKSADYAARIEQASRQAFENLLDLAIAEGCQFVLLAGDIFDGDLRNFQAGLFFLAGMRRLREAGIRVFIVLGNHDAENRFAGKLAWSDNVHLFGHRRAETVRIAELGVAIHGRSFWQRDVSENIAREYPPPDAGMFNIGVLHTACQGREGYHAVYAPCTVEQLVNHGYDYWALGHVHSHAVLNEHPHVVYPGNLQGRNPRETGPKGATLVTVEAGRIARLEHRALDVVRWVDEAVDITGAATRDDLLGLVRDELMTVGAASGDRPIALRLRLCGETLQHANMKLNWEALREEIEALLATLPFDLWLEKLELSTSAPAPLETIDPTIAGRLVRNISGLASDPLLARTLEGRLAEIRGKMPAAARPDELFAQLRATTEARAIDLAVSILSDME